MDIPEYVYEAAKVQDALRLATLDELFEELESRDIKPAQYTSFYAKAYAQAQIADARDELHYTVSKGVERRAKKR